MRRKGSGAGETLRAGRASTTSHLRHARTPCAPPDCRALAGCFAAGRYETLAQPLSCSSKCCYFVRVHCGAGVMGKSVQIKCRAFYKDSSGVLHLVGQEFNKRFTTIDRKHLVGLEASVFKAMDVPSDKFDGFFCAHSCKLKPMSETVQGKAKKSKTKFAVRKVCKATVRIGGSDSESSETDSDDDCAETSTPAIPESGIIDAMIDWMLSKVRCARCRPWCELTV